ncbi:Glycerol-3-phosphate acyltransferase 4 [Sarcoptes scabiei]|uniref:Glycerol-3-phosphate acyltransferase 4 n=1 Tax=Sarcoptes scabiei TaxID=52283 RepID=A0A834VCE4_SARSC|nr:Glycerol-3-phosphate acyltransferase 4 [Sarcoptes scabiei]
MLYSVAFVIFFVSYLGLASVGHRFILHQLYVKRLIRLLNTDRRNQAISNGSDSDRLSIQTDSSIASSGSDNDSAFDDDYDMMDVPFAFRPSKTLNLELEKNKHRLNLSTIMDFVSLSIQAIVDDTVTKRFNAEELKCWNLLTRTNKIHHYHSLRLASIWLIGLCVRYLILFPFRMMIALNQTFRLLLSLYYGFRMLSRAFSMVITYHDSKNLAKSGGTCVANHTSPIDVIVLHCNNAYALVGQKHSGVLGFFQTALSKATSHIWFDRFEVKDRTQVSKRLRDHSNDKTKLPILVFPEGTCINNSAVMMFKKGSFETDGIIYPVAIKYDGRFGDPFWNSNKYGYAKYLLMMMTSWAVVCDVWFLPPMTRQDNETAIEFASRVKAEIAKKGGLVDLEWDGQLKRQKVKPEMLKQQQYKFSREIE